MKGIQRGFCAAMVAALCGCGAAPGEGTSAIGDVEETTQNLVRPTKGIPVRGQQTCGFAHAGHERDFRTNSPPVKALRGRVTVYDPPVRRTLTEPTLGAHSLAEIASLDATQKNIAEIGWIVYDDDPTPRLFVFYWTNVGGVRTPKCNLSGVPHYRCDTFVSTHATIKPDMALSVGADVDLALSHVDSGTTRGWHFHYNGTDFGYIPDTAWGTQAFPSVSYGKWFGEVAGTCTDTCAAMGNSKLASDPSADTFSVMQHTPQGQSPIDTVFNLLLIQTNPARYTAAFGTSALKAPLRFGGPYPSSSYCPQIPEPPACTNPKPRADCCDGTVLLCPTDGCPIVCP